MVKSSLQKWIQVKVESLDERGRGVIHWQNNILSIPRTIPGEVLRVPAAKLTSQNILNEYLADRDLQEILVEPSPDRVDPPCPYFGPCGGCQLQHMSLKRQHREKIRWLEHCLRGLVSVEKIKSIQASPIPFHYRRRIQLHGSPQGKVGFYGSGSNRVIPIENCRIAAAPLNEALPQVKARLAEDLSRRTSVGSLSYELTLEEDGTVKLEKRDSGSRFLQINAGANDRLISFLEEQVMHLAPRRVLELFSGDGNLTFPLVAACQREKVPLEEWLGVESQPESHALAVRRTQGGSIPKFVLGGAHQELKHLGRMGRKFDLVLLDPPREGAASSLPGILKINPQWIFYVSCYPPTLGRDVSKLHLNGYRIVLVQPYDFFPQTMHVETVILLKKVRPSQN